MTKEKSPLGELKKEIWKSLSKEEKEGHEKVSLLCKQNRAEFEELAIQMQKAREIDVIFNRISPISNSLSTIQTILLMLYLKDLIKLNIKKGKKSNGRSKKSSN